MKQIVISDDLYNGIAQKYGDVTAYFVRVAQEDLTGDSEEPRFDRDEVLEKAASFRGMLKGATLEDVLSDRRVGAE